MTNSFLEDQAKARGMTVSELMRERGAMADKSKSGFAALKKNDPEKFKQILEKSAQTRKWPDCSECGAPSVSKGLCNKHYIRMRRALKKNEKTNPPTKSQG